MRTYGKLHRKGEKEYQDFKRYGRNIEWEK